MGGVGEMPPPRPGRGDSQLLLGSEAPQRQQTPAPWLGAGDPAAAASVQSVVSTWPPGQHTLSLQNPHSGIYTTVSTLCPHYLQQPQHPVTSILHTVDNIYTTLSTVSTPRGTTTTTTTTTTN